MSKYQFENQVWPCGTVVTTVTEVEDDVREVSCADTFKAVAFTPDSPWKRNHDGSYMLDGDGHKIMR